MAEVYGFTPSQVGAMTYDQVAVLLCDADNLNDSPIVTGTRSQLESKGIKVPRGLSLAELIAKRKKARKQPQELRKLTRKERRELRLARMEASRPKEGT